VFVTLEDETGVVNIVIWGGTMEKYRKVVMGARLMEVCGRVEADEGVIHVIAAHLVDATGELNKLSDDLLRPSLAYGDHGNAPPPGGPVPGEAESPGLHERDTFHQGHPRDARVIPKSRDFH
jgi:error-prone DNA polymerase